MPEEAWGQEQGCLESGPSNIGVPASLLEMHIHRYTADLLNQILPMWGSKSLPYQALQGIFRQSKVWQALVYRQIHHQVILIQYVKYNDTDMKLRQP